VSTHIVPNTCGRCGRTFAEKERAYYLAPCKVVSYGRGGYDGQVGIGRGAGEGELRVVFLGGVRRDRLAICESCIGALGADAIKEANK
jgi:hypothetical protein